MEFLTLWWLWASLCLFVTTCWVATLYTVWGWYTTERDARQNINIKYSKLAEENEELRFEIDMLKRESGWWDSCKHQIQSTSEKGCKYESLIRNNSTRLSEDLIRLLKTLQ